MVSVCSHLRGGGVPRPRSGYGWGYPVPGLWGYPIPGLGGWGGTLSQVWVGIPHSRSGGHPQSKTGWGTPPSKTGWGYPPPSKTGWGTPSPISKASTCYVAGSVPLAFTQEDFLVLLKKINFTKQ